MNKHKGPMVPPPGKATAELEASKDPQKFLKRKDLLNFKGVKGVAF